jgi:hypothetical protein
VAAAARTEVERHFSSSLIDANHGEVIDLLAGLAMWVTVLPALSGFSR